MSYKDGKLKCFAPALLHTSDYHKSVPLYFISIIEPECEERIDVMFVVDSSGTILLVNFQRIKDYVRDFVRAFQFSSDGAQFGLVSFSNDANLDIPLGTNRIDFFSTLERLILQGGRTNTYAGINLALEQFEANGRDGVPRVMLVITDGNSTDRASTIDAAAIARGMGITIISIGIGNVDVNELNEIATDPDSAHVFSIEDFTPESFQEILSPLVQQICSRKFTFTI